ncbi:MAG TPA: NYN domain-containing protein [Verrucomicrobiae bacterium]|nr:NYN domain-containing protein [Verrucomicrobiae bacterium]
MVVVDGYNLIGGEAGVLSGLSLEREREGLIHRLEQLSAVTGERFLIVFDGAAKPDNNARNAKNSSGKHPVAVAFSKPGESADDWIVKYFSRRAGKSARLITRDRKLADKVRKLGFAVEADLRGPESRAEGCLSQVLIPSMAGGGLFSSLSRQSREALAQARKKAKKQ